MSTLRVSSVTTNKRCIFVTSMGRTGTMFLGRQLGEIIHDCFSVHEPDAISLLRPSEWMMKLNWFGPRRITIDRIVGLRSLHAVGVARRRGKVSDGRAIELLTRLRRDFVVHAPGSVYCEANGEFNPLVDLIGAVFPNSTLAFIIRDPRNWVRSWMNKQVGHYGRFDMKYRLLGARLTPEVYQGARMGRWTAKQQFEQLCWTWNVANGYSLGLVARTATARVFRYEDILECNEKVAAFEEFVEAITSFPDGSVVGVDLSKAGLDRREHSSKGRRMPCWRDWTGDQARTLHEHCGDLMRQFGYGLEPEWLEKIKDG